MGKSTRHKNYTPPPSKKDKLISSSKTVAKSSLHNTMSQSQNMGNELSSCGFYLAVGNIKCFDFGKELIVPQNVNTKLP